MKKSTLFYSFLTFAIVYTLYILIAVRLQQLWFMILYFVALCILILVYIWINRGFPQKEINHSSLPAEWSESDKNLFISECDRRRKITKPILIFIICIALVLIFDIIFLYFGDYIKKIDIIGGIYD